MGLTVRFAGRLRRLGAHLRQVATDERLRSAGVGFGRLDYPKADIHLRLTTRDEFHRLRSCEKEPWTVRWIEQHLKPGETLYDVGANIGVYTLLAAVAVPGSRVVAFEPAPANFASLCANLDLNEVGEQVIALPVALGGRPRAAHLGEGACVAGASAAVGDSNAGGPAWGIVDRLDGVVDRFGLPLPDHAKIDVDGAELDVLAGADDVLGSSRLKSLMIELDQARGGAVVERLQALGYELIERSTGGDRPRGAPSYGLFVRA